MAVMKLTPAPTFALEQIVYLHVNPERKGMVTGLLLRPKGQLIYLVTWDDPVEEREHQECELSEIKVLDLPGSEDET